MFKKIKNYSILLWGIGAILVFSAVDYNLFGLFGGFGWSAVLLTLFAYLFVLGFLLYFLFRTIKAIFKFEKASKNFWIQFFCVAILSVLTFVWLDNRGIYPNSGYSEEFYK